MDASGVDMQVPACPVQPYAPRRLPEDVVILGGSSSDSGLCVPLKKTVRGFYGVAQAAKMCDNMDTDQFMNTGISTYIWVLSKSKPGYRAGKVQLIDASHCYEPRRKSIGTEARCRPLQCHAAG